jgi:hypothetical protein
MESPANGLKLHPEPLEDLRPQLGKLATDSQSGSTRINRALSRERREKTGGLPYLTAHTPEELGSRCHRKPSDFFH